MSRSKSPDPAVKRSISMPASLYDKMLARMSRFGFRSESAYLQFLTRNDVVLDTPPSPAEVAIPAPGPVRGALGTPRPAKKPAKKKVRR